MCGKGKEQPSSFGFHPSRLDIVVERIRAPLICARAGKSRHILFLEIDVILFVLVSVHRLRAEIDCVQARKIFCILILVTVALLLNVIIVGGARAIGTFTVVGWWRFMMVCANGGLWCDFCILIVATAALLLNVIIVRCIRARDICAIV